MDAIYRRSEKSTILEKASMTVQLHLLLRAESKINVILILLAYFYEAYQFKYFLVLIKDNLL